jgi:hypothetical protein
MLPQPEPSAVSRGLHVFNVATMLPQAPCQMCCSFTSRSFREQVATATVAPRNHSNMWQIRCCAGEPWYCTRCRSQGEADRSRDTTSQPACPALHQLGMHQPKLGQASHLLMEPRMQVHQPFAPSASSCCVPSPLVTMQRCRHKSLKRRLCASLVPALAVRAPCAVPTQHGWRFGPRPQEPLACRDAAGAAHLPASALKQSAGA